MLKRQMRLPVQSPWLRRSTGVAFILALSLTLVALHVRAYPRLSPIDELQHIDSLYRASHGQVVRSGEKVGQDAMREEACRGIDAAFTPPPCGAPHQPEQFQENGFNTAEVHPPPYYFATAAAARVVQATGLAPNLVDAGRLVGGLWLALGLLSFWVAGRLVGAGRAALTAVTVLIATTPQVLYSSATVTPDATALLAGGGLLVVVLLWERKDRWLWLLPVAAALAVLLKVTNIVGVLAVATYLVVRWWNEERGSPAGSKPRRLPATVIMLAGAGIAEVGWLIVRHALALPNPGTPPMTQRFSVSFLSPTQLGSQVVAFLTPISHPPTPTFFNHPSVLAVVSLFSALIVAACIGSVIYMRGVGQLESLALSGAATMLAGGPVLLIAIFLSQRVFIPLPSRYGLSFMPVLGAVVALSLRTRWLLVSAACLALASLVVTTVALAGAV